MLRSIVLTLFFLCQLVVFGQGQLCKEDLFPKRSKNKMYGYVNLFDQWKIQPIYTKVYPFQGKTAIVYRKSKYGAVNCESQVVLKPEFDEIKPFKGGVAWARKGDLWGLYNEEGDQLLEPKYEEIDEVSRFSKITFVKLNGKWGVYAQYEKKFLFEPMFESFQKLNSEYTLVRKGGKVGVIQHGSAEYAHEPDIESVVKVGPYVMAFERNGQWGVLNDKGVEITEAKYDAVKGHYKFRLLVEKEGKVGMIDYNGQKIAPTIFEEIAPFSEGGARFKKDGKYGFLSINGKKVIDNIYDFAGAFKDGQCIVAQEGKYGVINRKNEAIVPQSYKALSRGNGNYYVASFDQGSVLLNLEGKNMLKDTLAEVVSEDEPGLTRVKVKGGWRFVDANSGIYPFPGVFEKAEPFTHSRALVIQNGKVGAIDRSGKLVVPCSYDDLTYRDFYNYVVLETSLAGKVGMITKDNKEILPPKFLKIVRGSKNCLKVQSEDGFFITDYAGKSKGTITYEFMDMSSDTSEIGMGFPAVVSVKGKFGLVANQGREILTPQYVNLKYVGESHFAAKKKKGWLLLNSKGQIKEKDPSLFEDLQCAGDRFVGVKKGGLWGYFDTKALKVKLDFQYDEITTFYGGIAAVKKGDKWGAIDKLGKTVVPFSYDVVSIEKGTRKLFDGSKELLIDPNGEILN